MKIPVLLFIVTLVLSCDSKITPSNDMLGTWTWVKSVGGFAGQVNTPASSGDQITIEFSKNRYKKYVNGTMEDDLKYSIKLEKSIFNDENIEVITFSNGWKQSYSINDSSLFLSDECYDCFLHEYTRE
jgi:hypothetical protein